MNRTTFRQSEITQWQSCRRQHRFAYGENIVPVAIGPRVPASGKRDEGNAAHRGVEALNRGASLEDALEAVTDYVNDLRMIRQPEGYEPPPLTKEDDEAWWKVWRLACAMTTNYDKWLSEGQEAGVEMIAVEHEWSQSPADSELTVFGKIDAVLRDPIVDGIVVRDYKSVDTFKQTPQQVDFQLRTYAWAWWRESGDVPRRAEHLMMKRVLGQGEPPFFESFAIPINKHILRVHERHLVARVREMSRYSQEPVDSPELWPNPTRDCSWRCDYKVLCPMVDNGMDWEAVIEDSFAKRLDNE